MPLRLVLPVFSWRKKTRPMRPKRLSSPCEAQGALLRGLASSFSRSSTTQSWGKPAKTLFGIEAIPQKRSHFSPKVWHQHGKMKLYHSRSQTIGYPFLPISFIVQYIILSTYGSCCRNKSSDDQLAWPLSKKVLQWDAGCGTNINDVRASK